MYQLRRIHPRQLVLESPACIQMQILTHAYTRLRTTNAASSQTQSTRLSGETKPIKLLLDLMLRSNLLDLRVFQLLAASLPHLKLINGAHLLE